MRMLPNHRRKLSRRTVTTTVAGTAVALSVTVAGALSAQGAPTAEPAKQHAAGDGWESVGKDKTTGVSGIVPTGRAGHGITSLIVRDNKEPGQNRIAEVTTGTGKKPTVRPVAWKGSELPVDLEAIDAVPGQPGSYVALASEGKGFRFELHGHTAQVQDTFTLPKRAKGDNYENFALTSLNARHGKLAAVWGDRGQDSRPATYYAAPVSFDKQGRISFGDVTRQQLRAPYPKQDVRHSSDVKITKSGHLLASSASDPGDDGPFDSAVYDAGRISLNANGKVTLHTANKPDIVGKFPGHKVEGIACLPGDSGNGILGTDDENAGGVIKTAGICTS